MILRSLLRHYNEKANLIIDLGGYPSYDINGNYLLLLVKDFNCNCPLEHISSKSKREIIACIEKWVCHGFLQNITASNSAYLSLKERRNENIQQMDGITT